MKAQKIKDTIDMLTNAGYTQDEIFQFTCHIAVATQAMSYRQGNTDPELARIQHNDEDGKWLLLVVKESELNEATGTGE